MSITLKQFNTINYQDLIEWSNSPEKVMQWAGCIFHYPLTTEQLEQYRIKSENNPEKQKIFSIYEEETKKYVGHIELNNIDFDNKSAKICRVLIADNYRGKGYAQEALSQILKLGFEKLNLHRIDLLVFDFNKSAIKCYQKLGFSAEGILRDIRKVGNEYWNLIQMSILDYEYESIQNYKD